MRLRRPANKVTTGRATLRRTAAAAPEQKIKNTELRMQNSEAGRAMNRQRSVGVLASPIPAAEF